MLPLARKGPPVIGRTRIFCQVNLLVAPALLLAVIEILMVLVVWVAEMVAPLVRLLMLRPELASPFNKTVTGGRASKTKPAGALGMMVPALTSPRGACW